MKKQLNEIKQKILKDNKCLHGQENTKRSLIEIMKMIQDMRIYKHSRGKMEMDLKNPITQLSNAKESLKVERIKQKIEHHDLKMK